MARRRQMTDSGTLCALALSMAKPLARLQGRAYITDIMDERQRKTKPGPPKRFDHRIQVQLDGATLARIDHWRGAMPRSEWVRIAVQSLIREIEAPTNE